MTPVVNVAALECKGKLSLRQHVDVSVVPGLSSDLCCLCFLHFVGVVARFSSSFDPTTVSFDLPFDSPFSFTSAESRTFGTQRIAVSSSASFSNYYPGTAQYLLRGSSLCAMC